ncbi:uncharacterized protein DUF4280 [Desulfobotulus alkaliphilus]|uniref:Uncharacterized protein DUF4280 n=1 Tax=Desulfobotulus alkaliphilus TaxID=622671 RepID=A0A562RE44_9BACT|nr:DUF4280 domain-containing protein [Desulfobotulus alkaliphilus]TWI66676.1 uncharacterized protein DUF4280 [Desulfobotulus alkaliphilus]
MGFLVTNGAVMTCSFGVAPSSLIVLPVNMVFATTPAATIMDFIPIVNIPPFGMCTTPSNPAVAAATAAALGVLTPMPCVPVTVAPWVPGKPTVLIKSFPALTDASKLMCIWGGVISISFAGQVAVQL